MSGSDLLLFFNLGLTLDVLSEPWITMVPIPRMEDKRLVPLMERPKKLKKKIDPSVTSSTTYLMWTVLTANRCLCGEKPETNPLSYDSFSS